MQGSIQEFLSGLREELNKREVELINGLEKERQEKERELLSQKSELLSLQNGIRLAVSFSDELLDDGNSMEIAASHKPVIERFQALEEDMKKAPLWPMTDAMAFQGEEAAKEAIVKIGKIFDREVSIENSRVISNPYLILNQKYSIELFVADQNGEELTGVPISAFQAEIDGPSESVKVPIHFYEIFMIVSFAGVSQRNGDSLFLDFK